MRVILIGNYLPDRQESMERFALMLESGFKQEDVQAEIWRPTILFGGRTKSANTGLGKWLGYMDKWIVFPLVLRWRLREDSLQGSDIRFHICDHSNAPYLPHLPANRTAITCHDVLAIRGARGYADAYCPASGFGKILQQWILTHLSRARLLAADTQATLDQLKELTPNVGESKEWRVIHVGFNNEFGPMEIPRQEMLLSTLGISAQEPFLLCVGSNLARKNRKLLLDMVALLGSRWSGRVCYAGQAVDEVLMTYADSLGLKGRILSVVKPDHATLVALYGACEALIFPSFSEGFGWPVIEAQACGAPVIASILAPMPEVSGGAALHADPHQPQAFADAFWQLQDKDVRSDLIRRGFINCSRFTPSRMIETYLHLYGVKSVQRQPV